MKQLIDAAAGRILCDLVLKNARIPNPFTGEIIESDIAILGGKIVGLGSYQGKAETDLSGKYVLPGLIDTHVHIESSMVCPSEYAKAVLAHGVTTVIADPHEIANVCGEAGLSFMQEAAKDLPLDMFYMLPSCVPATPFEDAGAILDAAAVRRLLPDFFGLGEMMNYVGVVAGEEDVLKKLNSSIMDGHAPGLSGKELNAYLCAGIKTDHECTTVEEMQEKIQKGMYVLLREGTLSHDLSRLLSGITPHTLRRCCFCTDDRFIGDIQREGSIDHCIRLAIGQGLSPTDAITIATLNAAECYQLPGYGAIAPGYIADLVVSEDLTLQAISQVYKRGELVAENGKAVFSASAQHDTSRVANTVHLPDITENFFDFEPSKCPFPAIRLLSGTITTRKVMTALPCAKVCVIERHHGLNKRGFGFVENYGIQNGAIASTIGHDSHNVIVIGDNDADMALAVRTLGTSGGIAVIGNGHVLSFLPLPIGGLMSDRSMAEVIKAHDSLYHAAKSLQVNPEIDPFLSLAFLPLPVIPELRVTDRGLFDVTKFDFLSI